MKSFMTYLFQVTLVSGVLYTYYHLFLRNGKFHQYNRLFILLAFVTSLLFPLIHLPVYYNSVTEIPVVYRLMDEVIIGKADNSFLPGISSIGWLGILYAVVAIFLIGTMLYYTGHLIKQIRQLPSARVKGITIFSTTDPKAPYSFFKWVFWNNSISLDSLEGRRIFEHEAYHVRQKHSVDLLFAHVISCIFWVNPFFHLFKKELRAIHEFLADQHVASRTNKWDYAELLLMSALKTRQSLVHPFFHNQIKRRIAMITTHITPRYQYLRKLLVLPLAFIAFAAVSIQCQSKSDVTPPATESEAVRDAKKEEQKIETIKIQELDATALKAGLQDQKHDKVDIEAAFPGGVGAWRKFLNSNLDAVVPINNGAPAGEYTVFVQFVVNRDGSLQDIKPLTKMGYGMEDEVTKLMKNSPKWLPAIIDGKPVAAYRKQPITFLVTEE
jgi:hypothetical protein